MFDRALPQPQPQPAQVLLVDDDQMQFAITSKGSRPPGQACQLTIAVNGEEAMSFLEDAGQDAPKAAVVDLNAPEGVTAQLMDALRTKPWHHSDTPVIPYSSTYGEISENFRPVGYLVRNQPIGDLIDAIRTTLDLARPTP